MKIKFYFENILAQMAKMTRFAKDITSLLQ